MTRPRKNIYARTLGQTTVLAPRAITGQDASRRFMLTFTDATGIKAVEGHEITAVLDPRELSGVLMSIPAKDIPDEVWPAMLKVTGFLNRYHEGGKDD